MAAQVFIQAEELQVNRRLTALAIALAVLIVLLSGCITLPRYEWYQAAQPMEWYRWEQVERGPGFALLCGTVPPDRDKACVIRLNGAVIKPTDRNISTGAEYGKRGEGRLCLILSTASEEDAKRMSDQFYESTLWAHEVLKHCAQGLDHKLIPGRIG